VPVLSRRVDWLRQARAILAETYGEQPGQIVVTVASDDGHAITYTLPARPTDVASVEGLPPIARAILEASGPEPQNAKRLAGKAGYKLNSYFRDILRDLCRRELLRHTPDGYCRVS
jgi:hypothetical protein